jgi:hypothetical protein
MTNHEALEAGETIDSLSIRSRSSNRNPLSIRRAASMRVIADLAPTQIQQSSVVPAKAGTQYSAGLRGVLDSPAGAVIGPAKGWTRLRTMTREGGKPANRFYFTGVCSKCDYFAAIVRKSS